MNNSNIQNPAIQRATRVEHALSKHDLKRMTRDAVRRAFIVAFGNDVAFQIVDLTLDSSQGPRKCVVAVGRQGEETLFACATLRRWPHLTEMNHAWIVRGRSVDGVNESRRGFGSSIDIDAAVRKAVAEYTPSEYTETPDMGGLEEVMVAFDSGETITG